MRPTARLAAALLLVAAPVATPIAATEPPAAPKAPAAPKTPAEPTAPAPPEMLPVYDTTSVGALAVEAASRAAADSSRRLLVNFGTNDCAPCRTFNDAVYEEPFQTAFFAQFVPVFVDVSPGLSPTAAASLFSQATTAASIRVVTAASLIVVRIPSGGGSVTMLRRFAPSPRAQPARAR